MENSVKQYIISRVFTFCSDLKVKDNYSDNGFCAALPVVLPSSIFKKLSSVSSYLKRHHVGWYVVVEDFSGYNYELPAIRFYDDDEQE